MKRNLKPFILLETASFLSLFAGSMVFMLMPWIAIKLTGSATNAGLMVTLTSIPGLVLAPIMGSFIDRFGRRRLAILSEVAAAAVNLAIAVIAAVAGMNLATLIAIAVIRTIVGSGTMSARKSLVPDVAAAGNLTLERANSIHEAIAAAGFATGPAVAAILVSAIGEFNTFYVVAALGAASAVAAFAIRVHEHKEPHADDESKNWLAYSLQGFKILFETPAVLTLMSAFLVLAMIYLPTEMVVLPAFYNAIDEPEGLGFILSIMAISTTAGSLLFDQLAKRVKFSNIVRIALYGVSLGMIPMSLLPPQWIMLAAGVVLGLAWGPLPVLLNTVIQRMIPASKRGRVFSLEMTLWTAGPMITMTFAGAAVDAFGVHIMYPVFAGLVLLASVMVTTRKSVKELDKAQTAPID